MGHIARRNGIVGYCVAHSVGLVPSLELDLAHLQGSKVNKWLLPGTFKSLPDCLLNMVRIPFHAKVSEVNSIHEGITVTPCHSL